MFDVLCNAPVTFQRLMKQILGHLLKIGVLIYLDYVLLYSEDPERLIKLMRNVLKLLLTARLKCKTKK